jgi:hypothetical protein
MVRVHQTRWAGIRSTVVSKDYDLEAAQVPLGHGRADVIQVYAERDEELATRVGVGGAGEGLGGVLEAAVRRARAGAQVPGPVHPPGGHRHSRLVHLEAGRVTFTYADYADAARTKAMTLDGVEFLRRWVQHVLPRGFVKGRHDGRLANRQRAVKLAACRRRLAWGGVVPVCRAEPAVRANPCPVCGVEARVCGPRFTPIPHAVVHRLRTHRPVPDYPAVPEFRYLRDTSPRSTAGSATCTWRCKRERILDGRRDRVVRPGPAAGGGWSPGAGGATHPDPAPGAGVVLRVQRPLRDGRLGPVARR